jgi:hypothetical protein
MESKAVPGWANQEDVALGAALAGKARSVGRDAWNRRYAISEFLWTVDANRFLVAEAAGLPPGRAQDPATGEGRNAVWLAEQVVAAVGHELFIEKAHTVERIVDTDDGARLAIDCLVRRRRLP